MPSINEIKSQWGVTGKKKKEEQKQKTPSIDVIKSQWDGSYEQKKNDAKTELAKKKDELIAFKGSDLERSAKEALYYKDAASYSNKWGTPAEYDNSYKAYLDAMGRVRSSYDAKLNEMNAADQRYIPAMSQERAAKLSAENAGRRYAEQAPVYEQMARDAAALGDKDLFDRAQGGYNDLSGKYGNAYAAYIQAMNDDYKQRMGDLEKSDKGRYLYETTSKEDVDRRVKNLKTRQEELKAQMEEADLERRSMRNNPDLIWYDDTERFEDNEAFREYDRVSGLYGELQAEEERLEQELAQYQRAKDLYAYDDYLALREQLSPGGGMTDNEWKRLRDEGERKYRAVHERADKEKQEAKQGVGDTLLSGLSAYHALKMEKKMTEIEEDAGVVHDLEEARHLNSNDADIFYVLYAQDPEKAAEFIHTAKLQRDDEFQQYIADRIKDNPYLRWNAGMQGGAVAHLIGGAANLLDPYSETALEINRVGNALSMGAAQGAEEHGIFNTGALAGKIDENTPVIGDILGGKGLGDAYQLGTSMVESGLTAAAAAAVGDYGDAVVKVVEFLGTAIMGSSAAASDYDECIKRGLDRQQAMTHATAAGIAEAAFEYISLDKLVNQDITRGFVKNFFLQGGIEASEEACTTIANRITDAMLARQMGYDSSIEQRVKELMALGVDRKEAEDKAEREWLTELFNDAIGGFISGGFMTAGNTAMNWREYKAAREQNRKAGATARQTNQTDALRQYAEANDLGWYGEKFDEDAPVIDLTEEDLFAGEDKSPAEQTKQTRQEKRQERQALREQKRQLREQSKQDRQIGSDTQRVQAHIQEQFAGKSIQEQTQLRDQMIRQYGNGIAPAVYEAISVEAAKKAASLKSADEIRAARDQAVNETQDRAMKRAIADGYDQAVFGQAMRSGNADEAGRYFQQLRNTGEGGMTLEATVKDQDGQSRQIAITGMTEDGKGVKLADGSTVAVSKLRADADTMDAVQRIAELEMGTDADAVLQAYIKADKQGADGYRWLMDYSLAYEQGRTNKLSLEEAVKRSSLDQRTVMEAYTLGQRNAHQETKSAVEALKAMPKKAGITGKTSNIDTSEIEGITLNESEREQFEFANKVFSLIGVDVKWVASSVKNGRFVGANGSYLNGVVTLDVHAGRNFLDQVNSGVLATMGHELTHFLQQYAPEQYQALKEFLFRQIVQGSANGEVLLERMIWDKQRRASSKLSRKAAEDEVVADACQTMLRDSKAIREFAQQDEEAAKGVVRWLDKWFGKLKQAFSRSAQLTEEARFVDGLAKEVREAFGKLWDEALREAVETHDRVGNMDSANREQMSERETDEAYLDAVKNGDMETAQRMVDKAAKQAGAMTLLDGSRKPYYHGTAAKFTSFDINKSDDGTYGYGFYFSPMRSKAEGYGNVGTYYIMTDRIASRLSHNITPEQVLQIRSEYGLTTREGDAERLADWLPRTDDMHVMLSMENAITKNTDVKPAEFLQKFREVFGYDGLRQTNETVLFDNRLIKSADPVTYDNQGNVIPLSERFNTENQDIRYSERDTEYMDAVDRGDMETAQEMVEDAADQAGYTIKAYHGTREDFTVFDKSKFGDNFNGYSQLGGGFYFAMEEDEAKKWANRAFGKSNPKVMPVYLRGKNMLSADENIKSTVAEKALLDAGIDKSDIGWYLTRPERFVDALRFKKYTPQQVQDLFAEMGYDGIYEADGRHTQFVVFNPEQVKSADPVTYDDDGNVIPLSERFNTENQDIRYSERDELASDNQVHDITNRSGETVGVQDGNGHVQFSQRTWRESGKEKMQEYLDERVRKYEANRNDPEGMHPDDARALMDAVQEQYDALDEIVRQQPGNYKTYEQWADAEVETDIFGNPVFSWLKANGDYGISGDASLICVKRRTLDAVFDYMIRENMIQDGPEGLKLAQESIVAINDIIRAHGFETACSTCYIDARRYRAAIVAGSFCNVYNKLVRSMLKGKTGVPINAFNFGGNKSVTPLANSLDTLSDSEINWDGINKAIRDQEAKWESKGWEKFTEDGEEKWRRNGTVKNLPTSGTTEYRIALALKEKPSLRKLALRSDFLSGNGFLELNRTNKDILTLYNVKKGQAGPKATETDIQYLHEALENSFITPDRMFKAGGFRLQSFSDYVPRLVFDYVEIIGDLSAKGVPAHMYTKEILCVLQHGLTGTKINMSLIPAMVKKGFAPGLDADGNYLWRDGQTFGSTAYSLSPKLEAHLSKILGYQVKGRLTGAQGFELAKLIQNDPAYGKNNGTIAIGVSEAQIRKMLDDADIRMVIPYHKSGLNHILASMMEIPGFENYESYQNTLKWNGTKWAKVDVDFDFNEAVQKHKGDARAAAQDYLDWCEENGYKPKFSGVASGSARNSYNKAYDFTQHADWQTGTMTGEAESNYYKVLADFTCYDAEGKVSRQEAVKLNYPGTDSAFGSMKQLIEMGLESDAMLQAKQDAEVPKIVDDIRREIPKFEAAGRNMKAYAQLKENVEGRQYSERDYDIPSDLELMDRAIEGLSEAGGEEYWKALLESDPGLAEDVKGYKDQAEKLAAAEKRLSDYKKQMQLGGNRKLNTTGIPSLALKMMKDLGASDAKGRGVAKQVTQTLTAAYQKALDSIDKGMDDSSAFEIVYNEGVVPAAEIIAKQGTHSEKTGRGWITTSLESYYGEGGLQSIIDTVAGYVGADYALNRYRKAIQPTVADRIVERTEKRMQKQVDAATERATEAERINKKLTEDRDFWKNQQAKDSETVTFLNERLKEARQDLRDNKSLSSQERRKLAARINSLQTQLQAKREEIRALKSLSQQLDKQAVEFGQKQAKLLDKLEQQVQRERDILAGKLKPLGMQRLLKAEREKAAAKAEQHKDEVFANYKERQQQAKLRGRIKNLSDEMKRRMTNPSERAYVPASLYGSMTKLADVLDGVLAPGTGTKAEAKYRSMMDAIHGLAREYSAVKDLDDPTYSSEYDEEIQEAISDIERILERKDASWIDQLTGDTQKGLRELETGELQRIYELMRQINYAMVGATAMLGHTQFKDVYAAMRSVADQQNGMKALNSLNRMDRWNRTRLLNNLSVMRAAEMMSDWDRGAALYQLMHGIEQGADDAWTWVMDYNKAMEPLKTGKNEKEYRQALTKQLDFGITDKEGQKVTMTKLQALQILMTAEREAHNNKLLHLQTGGAVIRNATDLQNGKGAKARSQTIEVTPKMLQQIQNGLTAWDRSYMKTIRDYFQREGKRTNEILYKLKHKVLQTEEFYIPYNVDKNYLETNLNEQQAMSMWVKQPGSTNALKANAKQPVIIDGMDTVMARHVKEIGDYVGMAIPIRDFSKVYNGLIPTGEDNPLPVKETIDRTFGKEGQHLLTQAVIDVQGGTAKQNWSSGISEMLNKLHGSFVKSALLINPSVTIKQAASYIAAESVLSHRALVMGNRATFSSDASKSPALIAYLFANPEGKTARRIYNEIDQHTSLHYQRRLGMSQAEIAEQANRNGPIKRRMNAIGANMEQSKFGHAVRRAGENLNPVTWIQRMDVATTATLWVACKEQAKLDGMKAGTAEFWQHTTELYERCLRETQPMYDGLHRTANQKQAGGLMQYLFPFRTVPIQNHGQLAASYEALKASKNKSKAEQAAARKFFAKTVWAQTESAFVFSMMTFLAAALKRKTKKYRDEDEEFTAGSFAKGLLTDVGSTLFSVLQPMYGSELVSLMSRAADKFEGNSGYTYDAFSVGVVDMLNDLASSGDKLVADAGKLIRGEDVSGSDFWNHSAALLLKGAKLAGIPADTVKTYIAGAKGNVQDIIEGRIPALNDESWDRATGVNAKRFFEAWEAGDEAKMQTVLNEVRQSGKSEDSIANAFNSYAKNAYENNGLSLEQYADYLDKTGMFDAEKISGKIKNLVRDEFQAGERSEDEAISALTGICGMDEDAAWKTVQRWEAGAEHDGEEDYSYSQYEDLREALDAGKSLEDAGKEYLAHGYTEEQIVAQAVSWLKDQVTAGKINEDRAIQLLRQYKGMDADKAWKKVQEWKAKAEHAEDEDYSWSQYDEIDAAIDGNKDIGALVKQLTSHGVEEKSVTSHVKSYLIQRYEDKALTESQFRNQLSRYCGIVAKKDVDEIVNNANCFRDSGFHYSELKTAYNAKELTGDKARQMLTKYGGMSAAEAKSKTRYWDFEVKYPDANLSIEKVNAYYDTRPANYGKTMEQAGISVQSYISYCQQASKATGTDKDGDGRTDSGSKKAAIMKIIDSLNLTRSQKDALYYLNNWSQKTISEAPWH